MTDKLFSIVVSHKNNLQQNKGAIVYYDNTFNKKAGLDVILTATSKSPSGTLPNYKYFKTIKLEDILLLRATLDITSEVHQLWCKKIHQFLEFRLSSIAERIQKNYSKKEDRITLIQNVITLLLEYYVKTNDGRYLSIAMKLLRNKSLGTYGFLRRKKDPHYSYNIMAVYNLTKNL